MKIALASARLIDRDVVYNLKQMERFMGLAKENGADLVCFGETFLQGFDSFDWEFSKDGNMAVSTDSDVFGEICRISRALGTDVLFGYAELCGDAIYSSCALVAAGTLRHNYRRISRGWKEFTRTDDHYREGTVVEVFEYRGRRFAIGLCGDLWEYPERFQLGEDILLWPVYISYTPEEWTAGVREEYVAQARLCCDRVLMVNSLSDGDAHGGAAFFAYGEVAAELPMGKEGLLFVEV